MGSHFRRKELEMSSAARNGGRRERDLELPPYKPRADGDVVEAREVTPNEPPPEYENHRQWGRKCTLSIEFDVKNGLRLGPFLQETTNPKLSYPQSIPSRHA
jgi:hypothetical protein